jgi:hypothetical protein
MALIPKPVTHLGLYPYSYAIEEIAVANELDESSKSALLLEMAGAIAAGKMQTRVEATGGPAEKPTSFVTVQDVNTWLTLYGYIFNWKIIPSNPNLALKTPTQPKPVIKGDIALVFADTYFTRDKWKKYLADPPKWLEGCRIAKGNKNVPSTWNPVKIAIELSEKRIPTHVLNKIMKKMPEWADDWAEKSEFL